MTRALLIFGALLGATGCGASSSLEALDLEVVESALGTPTGELERTDAIGVAYTLYNARTLLGVVSVAADALPGINRSPLFERTALDGCTKDVARGTEVDLPCLGHHTGKVRVEARSELANDNGTYELAAARASLSPALIVDGSFTMRVEGIANPLAVEKTTLAPTAIVDGMPRFFERLEQAGIVIDNSRGNEDLYYVVAVLAATFVAQVDEVQSTDEYLVYTVRDAKNLWSCTTRITEDNGLCGSECRTPVGQGDFAELRFGENCEDLQ